MINTDVITSEWSENVVPVHAVPENLFPHQVDTMALVKEGKHVFLGIHFPHLEHPYNRLKLKI